MNMLHRIESKVGPDGIIILNNLPFSEGETVEIIIINSQKPKPETKEYPLHGKPVFYEKPFDAVAENEWSVLS
jgi:hypothetical protein